MNAKAPNVLRNSEVEMPCDGGSASSSPLWRLLPRGAGVITLLADGDAAFPLYCAHPITCDVTPYVPLARCLGSDRRVFGIQMPAAKLDATFGLPVEALASYYADSLSRYQPDGPLALAGWSAGSTIALEMAQQLRARGRDVRLLVVFDGVIFNTGRNLQSYFNIIRKPPPRDLVETVMFGKEFGVLTSGFPGRVGKKIVKLYKRRFMTHETRVLEPGDIIGDLDITGWSEQHVLFVRALYKRIREYVPKPYAGKILNYVPKSVPLPSLLTSAARWQKIARQVETVYVEGGHVSMLRDSHVVFLAHHLRHRLKKAMRG
jgi:thioesterase domain-containing protein